MQEYRGLLILDGDDPVEVTDVVLWSNFMAEAERTVLVSVLHTPTRVIEVTTFFLGANVIQDGEGPFQFVTRTDCEGLIRPRWSKDRRTAEAAHAAMVATLQRRS